MQLTTDDLQLMADALHAAIRSQPGNKNNPKRQALLDSLDSYLDKAL